MDRSLFLLEFNTARHTAHMKFRAKHNQRKMFLIQKSSYNLSSIKIKSAKPLKMKFHWVTLQVLVAHFDLLEELSYLFVFTKILHILLFESKLVDFPLVQKLGLSKSQLADSKCQSVFVAFPR